MDEYLSDRLEYISHLKHKMQEANNDFFYYRNKLISEQFSLSREIEIKKTEESWESLLRS